MASFQTEIRVGTRSIPASYVIAEAQTYLVVCSWNYLQLLYCTEGSTSALKAIYPYVLAIQGEPYYWVSTKRQDLFADRPYGYIVSHSGWEKTIYKTLHWAFQYRNCEVTQQQLETLTSMSISDSNDSPLQQVASEWYLEDDKWQRRPYGTKLIKVIHPQGLLRVLLGDIMLKGVFIEGQPPVKEVLENHILTLIK